MVHCVVGRLSGNMKVLGLVLVIQLFFIQDARSILDEIEETITYNIELGDTVAPKIYNLPSDSIKGCYIQQHWKDLIQFRPVNLNTNEDLVLQTTGFTTGCGVAIRNIKEEYIGDWELISWILGSDGVEKQVVQPFTIVLKDSTSSSDNSLPLQTHSVSLGGQVPVTVLNGILESVNGCHLQKVHGDDIEFVPTNRNTNVDFALSTSIVSGCGVIITNVKQEYLGEWELRSSILGGDGLKVVVQPFIIVDKDAPSGEESTESTTEDQSSTTTTTTTTTITTANPIDASVELEQSNEVHLDEVQTLEHETFETELGKIVQARIPYHLSNTKGACKLRNQEGVDFDLELLPEGVELLDGSIHSSCFVQFTVSEAMHGDWMLYSFETNNNGQLVEIQLPFTIYIEEHINTFPSLSISIETGKDLYIRLEKPIQNLESCKLSVPENSGRIQSFRDDRYMDYCGYTVSGVGLEDAGEWQIEALGTIAFRAKLQVIVEDPEHPEIVEHITLTHGEPISMDLGPDNALFCQMRNPSGQHVFSGLSQCRLDLDRVTEEHEGLWSVSVGLPGRLTALEHTFRMDVEEGHAFNTLTQSIRHEADSLSLSCSMLTDSEYRTCRFIRPDSSIFIAHEGIGEGRYSFFGNGVSTTDSGHFSIDCGLRVMSPGAVDFGNWRCMLETEDKITNGYLRVENMANAQEDLNAIESEVLDQGPTTSDVVAIAGETITLSCNVQASIQYCWFRSRNGTIISVRPDTHSADYEYIGNGFDSGDCGIKINHASILDGGHWTCNVGIDRQQDMSAQINVTVLASPMRVLHGYFRTSRYSNSLAVEGRIYNESAVSYCRFVNPAGNGFNTNSDVTGYSFSGTDLSRGICRVTVETPGWNEHGTWTVSALLTVTGQEVSSTTMPQHMWHRKAYSFYSAYSLLIVMLIILNFMFISVLINKRTRRWTSQRVNNLGSSIRNSFRKRNTTRTEDQRTEDDWTEVQNSKVEENSMPPPTYDQVAGPTSATPTTPESGAVTRN